MHTLIRPPAPPGDDTATSAPTTDAFAAVKDSTESAKSFARPTGFDADDVVQLGGNNIDLSPKFDAAQLLAEQDAYLDADPFTVTAENAGDDLDPDELNAPTHGFVFQREEDEYEQLQEAQRQGAEAEDRNFITKAKRRGLWTRQRTLWFVIAVLFTVISIASLVGALMLGGGLS